MLHSILSSRSRPKVCYVCVVQNNNNAYPLPRVWNFRSVRYIFHKGNREIYSVVYHSNSIHSSRIEWNFTCSILRACPKLFYMYMYLSCYLKPYSFLRGFIMILKLVPIRLLHCVFLVFIVVAFIDRIFLQSFLVLTMLKHTTVYKRAWKRVLSQFSIHEKNLILKLLLVIKLIYSP